MDAITLGKPNLFVKGVVEQTLYDTTTGNIINYDNIASESAITSEVNLQEITGGIGNATVGIIPDTTKLTGTYTSQGFSLQNRRLISGGKLGYNGVSSVCETIKATGATLTVSRTPAKHYAQPASDTNCWCYVREVGDAQYEGTNYSVSPDTKQVVNFVATNNKEYEVFYFIANPSAEVLELPDDFNPVSVAIQQKYGVYAKQNNSVTQSTLQGYLYVYIPSAILSGDAGLSASQTENATSDGSWTAIAPDNTIMSCADCGGTRNAIAYYVYVPCGETTQSVEALAIVGAGTTLAVEGTALLPLKYVMPDGSLAQPDFAGDGVQFTISDDTVVSVTNGVITALATGTSTIVATLNDLTSSAYTVTVTA